MPGTTTTGSANIAILDSKIIADLCAGKFYIDASPSVYIGSGDQNVLGANVEIINPFGVTVKPYGDNYEIAPGLSGGMDGVIAFNVPTIGGAFQYGTYTINVKLFDGDDSWVVTKTVTICEPDKNYKTRTYGSLSAKLDADCKNGKLYVMIDSIPNYRGYQVESKVLTGTLKYPTASGVAPLAITNGNFAVVLYEGVYELTGEICATYNFGDNVFVKVKYKVKKEKSIRCIIDFCCVLSALKDLQARLSTDCTDEQKAETASIIVEALSLLRMAELAANCGEDASEYIDDLEELLGCKCTCNCNEGAPIIGTTPASDIVIEGCNVSTSQDGLTTIYTINNYEYVVDVDPNGGVLVAAAATLDDCTKTQKLTFSIVAAYNQIKELANANNTEADFWASVINKSLRDVDPACLGITANQWQALAFPDKIAAILQKLCNCCGSDCSATIDDEPIATKVGGDVHLSWSGTAHTYLIYLDGLLVATYLTNNVNGEFVHIFPGAADGDDHTWIIEAYCSDKTKGDTKTGTFGEIGCPTIPPPAVSGITFTTATCPFDLTTVIDEVPAYAIEYHTANNTLPSSLVPDPTQVSDGEYWIFYKDDDGCYSVGRKVTIICGSGGCTAPQNLQVIKLATCNFWVQFQSAAYPPDGGYMIKRRLASDPDLEENYTTVGAPTWNASLNRWGRCDFDADQNTLYVYRASSLCGESEPYTDYAYAYIVCPAVTTYPTYDSIAYSFVPVSGASHIYVDLLDASGTTVIETQTYIPAFDNPIEGLFEYLDPDTNYKLRLRIKFTSGSNTMSKTCSSYSITTDIAP